MVGKGVEVSARSAASRALASALAKETVKQTAGRTGRVAVVNVGSTALQATRGSATAVGVFTQKLNMQFMGFNVPLGSVKIGNAAGFVAMVADYSGGALAKGIAEFVGADEYKAAVAEEAGGWTGAITASAIVGGASGGPAGAIAGAVTGAGFKATGEVTEYLVDSVFKCFTPEEDWIQAPVDMPVGTNEEFTKKDVAYQFGVKAIRVIKSSSMIYSYKIEVKTFKKVHLEFTDGEPDTYHLRCQVNGEHNVRYNSKSPGLKFIKIIPLS